MLKPKSYFDLIFQFREIWVINNCLLYSDIIGLIRKILFVTWVVRGSDGTVPLRPKTMKRCLSPLLTLINILQSVSDEQQNFIYEM